MGGGFDPANTIFVVVSFEGPDIYSQAGGLGVRVTELSRALAQQGFETHLYFIGDPTKPAHESGENDRWHLHRWCQWVSQHYPGGVYQGEAEKLHDFGKSIPPALIEMHVKPAIAAGKVCVLLFEEWHTAETAVHMHNLLRWNGMREACIMFWNANNTYGFNLIPWDSLSVASTITTVSKYMKHKMWPVGVNPLVIPNGIPSRHLHTPSQAHVDALRAIFAEGPLLAKVGRFDPDKRWIMAVDALATLKGLGSRPHMLVRGGLEPHRMDTVQRALLHGLTWAEVTVETPSIHHIFEALDRHAEADILELRFFVPEEFLRTIYRSADAVFANSGHEPFGLVGLEVMATGGIAFTGATGEDYAQSFHNAVVVDSEDAREMAVYVLDLMEHPQEKLRIRHNARQTATYFTWEEVLKELYRKLQFAAQVGGVTTNFGEEFSPTAHWIRRNHIAWQ